MFGFEVECVDYDPDTGGGVRTTSCATRCTCLFYSVAPAEPTPPSSLLHRVPPSPSPAISIRQTRAMEGRRP
eukprot:1014419-Pleurochrysis_carterae.AAC.1